MRNKHVLVTGGAGFIGSQLVKRLMPLAKKITVIDDLTTGNRQAVPVADHVTFVEASITDADAVTPHLADVDILFHVACRNLVHSVENMEQDLEVNLLGCYSLLDLAHKHCQHLQRFVYTSTASVYGDADVLPTVEEYHKIAMPYAASKFSAEHYCHVFHQLYQFPMTILRLSNVYGPGQLASNPYCGVVAKFFDAIMANEPLTIYGDGTQTRDFTYIEDALDALLLAASRDNAVGEVFNVGTMKETSIQDLARSVIEEAGYDAETYPIIYAPKRKVDTIQRRVVAIDHIQNTIGWQPLYSLKQGIAQTFHWVKE